MTELLVTVSMRFPVDTDRRDLCSIVAPVLRAAVAAGGLSTALNVYPSETSPEQETPPDSYSPDLGEDGASFPFAPQASCPLAPTPASCAPLGTPSAQESWGYCPLDGARCLWAPCPPRHCHRRVAR